MQKKAAAAVEILWAGSGHNFISHCTCLQFMNTVQASTITLSSGNNFTKHAYSTSNTESSGTTLYIGHTHTSSIDSVLYRYLFQSGVPKHL